MAGFREALMIVLESEGGLADDPEDMGGRTNLGISAETWARWRDRLGKPGQPVDACTRDDAERIYFTDYWHGGMCDALAWPVSLVHFDSVVQHAAAATLLQRAVGVKPDGIVGPVTLDMAGKREAKSLAEDLLWVRLAYYRTLPTWEHHGRGWTGRMVRLRKYVVGRAA